MRSTDFHAGLEHLGGGRLFIERGRETVDRHALGVGDRAKIVHGLADDVHHAAERAAADRSGDGATLIDGLHAPHHAVGRFHGDAAYAAFAEMLLHFQNDVDGGRHGEAVADNVQRLINGRHRRFGELHVNGGAGDLDYVSDIF